VNVRKIVAWLIFVLVVLYVIQSPDDAAQLARGAGYGLADVASALASFLGSLA
jgi:hypothetical protein